MFPKHIILFMMVLLTAGFFFLAAPEQSHAGFAQIQVTCCQQEGSCYDNSEGGGALACPNGMFVDGAVCNETDGVCVAQSASVNPVPTLSEWGLIAMAGVLGIVGYLVVRRRRVSA